MITVRVRQTLYNKGIACIPSIQEYTGDLIKNPSWVGSDSICLTTREPRFPFRIIKKHKIVDQVDTPKETSDYNEFEVRGSKGDIYKVIRDKNTWTCTCLGFEFRHSCKHILAGQKYLERTNG